MYVLPHQGASPEEQAMPTDLINAREFTKWEEASYAFLAEKERRSGSIRTVQSYQRMLKHFFANGKTPDQVTSQEAFGWAHGIGLSGKTPSSVTVGARIGCLSSFYRFLIRMGLVVTNSHVSATAPPGGPPAPRWSNANVELLFLLATQAAPATGEHGGRGSLTRGQSRLWRGAVRWRNLDEASVDLGLTLLPPSVRGCAAFLYDKCLRTIR
jgi:hypothetical protein